MVATAWRLFGRAWIAGGGFGNTGADGGAEVFLSSPWD
jgi:hypothetical protein